MSGRACVVCGGDLHDRRSDARTCGPSCRREASRIRRILAGLGDSGYRTLPEYLARAQRRAKVVDARFQ